MPQESYIFTEETEEVPLGQVLKARTAATADSGVTATGKRVAENVPLQGVRGKRPRNVNVSGQKDRPVTFKALASQALEVPRGRLSHLLNEAGMADKGFI